MIERCRFCHELDFWGNHVCPPSFNVWPDHYDEDEGWTIYARDEEEAAEKWADQYDCGGDYTIINGSPEEVSVRRVGGGEIKRFEVHGETEAVYYAEPIDPA